MSTSEILLITRLRTLNKGNQALSAAWLELAHRAFPAAAIRVLERRPRHLVQYRLADLRHSRDPFRDFDALATRIARLAPGPAFITVPGVPPRIALDETIAPAQRFVALRQRLNLRGLAARAGIYADEYKRRLAACQRADLVIVNPAGEFYPREPDPAYYHLLDAYVAVKLGRRTAMVNHTMDITDPTLRRLIPAIYRTLDLVEFRDEKSVGAFRDMGGKLDNVVVAPDLALASVPVARGTPRANTVALAVNVPEATARGYADAWIEIVASLIRAGFEVSLVSNEVPADAPFYDRIAARTGVQLVGAGLDFDRYAELLGTFGTVVSSRMHTAVLAMLAGTPVVPVEGSSFKITGLFQELGVSTTVVAPGVAGWVDRVVREATSTLARRAALVDELVPRLAAVRERIDATLIPRLRAAAGDAEAAAQAAARRS